MKNLLVTTLILLAPYQGAEAASSAEKKIERLENDMASLQRERSAKAREFSAAGKELSKARTELAEAEARQEEFLRRLPSDRARDPGEEDRLSALKQEVKRASAKRDSAEALIASLKEEQTGLKEDAERKEEALDRANEKKERLASDDCPSGNCAGAKKGPPNQPAAKSGWENAAEIIKAVTPIGLGAMNTYLGVKAIDKQSSDYRFYNESNTALGLPSAAPTGYSGLLGGFSSLNGAIGMGGLSSFGLGGMGMGYGLGMGLGMGMGYGGMGLGTYGLGGFGPGGYGLGSYGLGYGYGYGTTGYGYGIANYGTANYGTADYGTYGVTNPYASYGVTNPYTAAGAYPSYGTASTVWNASSMAAAQMRAAQQQSIFSSDALAAQQSLLGSYSSYNQVMQSVGAVGTTPYGSYINYGSGIYGGMNTIYNPAVTTPTLTGARQ